MISALYFNQKGRKISRNKIKMSPNEEILSKLFPSLQSSQQESVSVHKDGLPSKAADSLAISNLLKHLIN